MRRAIVLLVVLLSLACVATRPPAAGRPAAPDSAPAAERDGSSFEKAVLMTETSETAGVPAEYRWVAQHYPGSHVTSQAVAHHENSVYDILTVSTPDGEREIYFDITSFFGKF